MLYRRPRLLTLLPLLGILSLCESPAEPTSPAVEIDEPTVLAIGSTISQALPGQTVTFVLVNLDTTLQLDSVIWSIDRGYAYLKDDEYVWYTPLFDSIDIPVPDTAIVSAEVKYVDSTESIPLTLEIPYRTDGYLAIPYEHYFGLRYNELEFPYLAVMSDNATWADYLRVSIEAGRRPVLVDSAPDWDSNILLAVHPGDNVSGFGPRFEYVKSIFALNDTLFVSLQGYPPPGAEFNSNLPYDLVNISISDLGSSYSAIRFYGDVCHFYLYPALCDSVFVLN